MLGTTGSYLLDAFHGERVIAERETCGWRIFRVPAQISSKDDFFEGVRSTFPLDLVLRTNQSWNALADSLWGGLDGLADQRIVVVWTDAFLMKQRFPEEYSIAIQILSELPETFSSPEMTAARRRCHASWRS